MYWKNYNEERPTRSGAYFTSVSKSVFNGESKFLYVAYYDVETDKWYKYDPFEKDGCNILEEIAYFGDTHPVISVISTQSY